MQESQIFSVPLCEVLSQVYDPSATLFAGRWGWWELHIRFTTWDHTSIYLLKVQTQPAGTAIPTHEPLGAVALLWFDCGSLNRIIYSQCRRKAEGEMNQTGTGTSQNIYLCFEQRWKTRCWRWRGFEEFNLFFTWVKPLDYTCEDMMSAEVSQIIHRLSFLLLLLLTNNLYGVVVSSSDRCNASF